MTSLLLGAATAVKQRSGCWDSWAVSSWPTKPSALHAFPGNIALHGLTHRMEQEEFSVASTSLKWTLVMGLLPFLEGFFEGYFQTGQRFYQIQYINETKSRNSLSCSHVHLMYVFAYIYVYICIFIKDPYTYIYMNYPNFKLNKNSTRFLEVKNIHNSCNEIILTENPEPGWHCAQIFVHEHKPCSFLLSIARCPLSFECRSSIAQ